MIWTDSSFAIEWLAELERVKKFDLPKEPLGILPSHMPKRLLSF